MSISEWLETRQDRKIMTERITDAELAANWAATALTEGRYELGRTLANIAAQAAKSEAMIEQDQYLLATPAGRDRNIDPPTQQLPASPPPTARCWHAAPERPNDPCHAQTYLDRPAMVWRHIDPDLDQHHEPLILTEAP